MNPKRKKEWKETYGRYTLLFLAISLGPIIYFILQKKSFINTGDAADGFYPGFVYIGNYIRQIPYNLIHYHRLPSFDFVIGFGGNIFETIGIAGDPFNWLAVFFPNELSVYGYNFCIFLRLYLGGYGFLVWANRKGLQKSGIIGALSYAFCSFAMNTGIHFYNYLTAFTMLPFIAAGVDDIIDRRKCFSGILLFGITVTALDGFAFLYMDTVFFAFYLPIRSLSDSKSGKIEKKECKSIWKNLLLCIKHYFLSLGIASPFFIQDLYGHLLSSRSKIDLSSIFIPIDPEYVLNRIKGFVSNINYPEGLGIGILCFVAIFVLFQKKKYRDIQWIVIFVVVGHLLLGFQVLMNCFIYQNSINRWNYILFFTIFMAMAIGLDELFCHQVCEQKTRKHYCLICFCVLVLCIILPAIQKGLNNKTAIIRFVVTVVTWIITIYIFKCYPKRRWHILTGVCIALVIVNAYPTFVEKYNFIDSNIYTNAIEGKMSKLSDQDQQKGALRTDVNDSICMVAQMLNRPGTRSYYSVQNDGLFDFLQDMACSTSIYGGSVQMIGLDGRKSLEMLMSVGSYSDDRGNTIIHSNEGMILPVGFAYDSYMLNEESLKMDPLDRSHLALQSVYLDDNPEAEIRKMEDAGEIHDWEIIPTEVDYSAVEMDEGWVTVRNGADIYVRFQDGMIVNDEQFEYYLYISSIESVDSLSWIDISQMKVLRFTPAGEAANQRGEYLIKLAINDRVIENGYIDLSPWDGRYKFGEMELRKLDISGYEDDCQKLMDHALRNISMTPDRITGEISCEEDSVLFTSILYDTRWSCLIDGIPAKLHKADSGFLAAEVSKGKHQVVLEYRSNLGWIGLLIGVASIAGALVWARFDKKKIMTSRIAG